MPYHQMLIMDKLLLEALCAYESLRVEKMDEVNPCLDGHTSGHHRDLLELLHHAARGSKPSGRLPTLKFPGSGNADLNYLHKCRKRRTRRGAGYPITAIRRDQFCMTPSSCLKDIRPSPSGQYMEFKACGQSKATVILKI